MKTQKTYNRRSLEERKEIAKQAQKLLKDNTVTNTALILGMSRDNLIRAYIKRFGLKYRKNAISG